MSSSVVSITLTGTITKEGDEYISYCDQLRTATTGKTYDEVWRRTEDMINAYFVAAHKLGTLGEELMRLREVNAATTLPPGPVTPREFAVNKQWKMQETQQVASL